MLRGSGLSPAPMKRRLASSLAALLSAAAALSACQGSDDQGPVNLSKGVPVGAVLALTGNANVYGQDQKSASSSPWPPSTAPAELMANPSP